SRARLRFASRRRVYYEGRSPAHHFSANGENLLTGLSHFRGPPPPAPEPIAELEDDASETFAQSDRHEARFAFWQVLLAHANENSDLHSRISANRFNWLGMRRHGQWWNYVVLQDEVRVELYIDAPEAKENKVLFDALHADRKAIEAEFEARLCWQRLDDKRASRISFTVPGGWVDDTTWPSAVAQAVNAMQRLYRTLAPRVQAAN
ncbi:MAG: DUF4268 domain-containing protein, partial [Bryobacterales bacterium]|nr:DUF4268 domain-containing protein [Bryobacterales bacterium]